MLSARKQLDIVTAYREVGTYRGAAEMCGVTHKTVSRVVNRAEAVERRTARRRNYESVQSLVATKIDHTKGKISAKRLLPTAKAALVIRVPHIDATPSRAAALPKKLLRLFCSASAWGGCGSVSHAASCGSG